MPRADYKIPAGWLAVLCACCVVLGYLMACWELESEKSMSLEEYTENPTRRACRRDRRAGAGDLLAGCNRRG